MADDGFDPCESIWAHEVAMQRLLSILRQSQAYCSDNECLNEIPGPANSEQNFMLMAFCWFIFAVVLFFLRPNALRRRQVEGKPRNTENDANEPPLC